MGLRIEALTNKVTHIQGALLDEMGSCQSISIASSFIDQNCISIIENVLRKNKKLRAIRLVIGVYGNFNRKKNLHLLFTLAKKYSAKLQVHISRTKKFHWKYYQLTNRATQCVFIGSANFTSGGLGSNNELVIKLTDRINANRGVERLNSEFEKEWEQSGPVSEFNLDEYNECPLHAGKTAGKAGNVSFFNPKAARKNLAKPNSDKALVIYFRYEISRRTERMITNYRPDWNNVDFFVCENQREFEQSCKIKRFLIIDRRDKRQLEATWAYFLNDQVLKTPDGQYFIAYKNVGKTRILSNEIIEELTSKESWNFKLFGRKNVLRHKVIGKSQVSRIEELLKLKMRKK